MRTHGAAAVCLATRCGTGMLEVSPDDLEWETGRFFVTGDPDSATTIGEVAMAAHGAIELSDRVEGSLEAQTI